MEKSIIIIGAGISGLSAGCYARMNGFKTTIFEMNDNPGGQCVAWKRKDFIFDPCIHWLLGTTPENSFYRIWEELGAIKDKKIFYFDEFCRIKTAEGKELIFYSNINKFMYQLKEFAPEDGELIDEITGAVNRFGEIEFPVDKNITSLISSLVKLIPCMKYFFKYSKITVQDFAKKFKNPFLRKYFLVPFDMPDFSLIAMLFTLAWFNKKKVGYPVGGSMDFSRAIEKRFKDLGGEILYNKKVERIRIINDKASGIKLEDGSKYSADYVISACDGKTTIYKMLNGEFTSKKIDSYYKNFKLFPPILFISLGLKRDLKETPHTILFELDKPLKIADKDINFLWCRHTAYDPLAAPFGKSVLSIFIETDYDYWKKLRINEEDYKFEKQKVVTLVIDALNNFYPDIISDVEIYDMATPVTFEQRTGVWRGSYEGWLPTPQTLFTNMEKTLPGLDNFYLIGQWTTPGGGLPTAAKDGRDVIYNICKKEKIKFVTSII